TNPQLNLSNSSYTRYGINVNEEDYMNPISRGMRSALRNPLRSGAIALILAMSIGLIVAMLVARTSVLTKIDEVKAENATQVTIRPAGVMGGFGGGDPLTA